MVYFIPFVLCFFFAVIYDFQSNKQGKWFCYALICVLLICISGFRYKVGGDTIRYMESFQRIHLLDSLSYKDMFGEGMMPLCYLFFSTCRSISDSFYFLQFIHACIVNITIFVFIKRQTPFVFCTILIYIIWSYLEFNTEILRESLAVCAFLCGFHYLKKKMWFRYYLWCIIAVGFHVSALLTLVLPLFYFIKFDWKILVICFGAALLSATVYKVAPELLTYLDLIGGDSSLMEARYFSNPLEVKNWHAQALYVIKWFIFPICSFGLVCKGKYCEVYPYFGFVALMMILSSFSFYSYAFYRLINYLMPFIWVLTGLAMRSLPTVFKPFSKMVVTSLSLYLIFSLLSIYVDYLVTEREDMLKYFPYVSIFEKREVYRPEW